MTMAGAIMPEERAEWGGLPDRLRAERHRSAYSKSYPNGTMQVVEAVPIPVCVEAADCVGRLLSALDAVERERDEAREAGTISYTRGISKPCAVCGEPTILACSDCAIESGGKDSVHVCEKGACRDQHDATHRAALSSGDTRMTPPEEALARAREIVAWWFSDDGHLAEHPMTKRIALALTAAKAEGLRQGIEAAAQALAEARAEIERLTDRQREIHMLAFKWMEQHDKLMGFIQGDPEMLRKLMENDPRPPSPAPTDLPCAIAERDEARAALAEASEWARQVGEEYAIRPGIRDAARQIHAKASSFLRARE